MKYMVIVAHPDDEVLGLGGFLYDRLRNHDEVCVVIVNDSEIPSRPDMANDMNTSHSILGINHRFGLGLENLKIASYSPTYVVPRMEEIINEFSPEYIFTHSPTDINPDHRAVSEFTQQAARYYQRRPCTHRVRGLFFMEVLSSTEWGATQFEPDTYFEISKEGLENKIRSLACYKNVLRHDTHPRSDRAITALAILRGCTVGVPYAEAVKTCWRIEDGGRYGKNCI